MKNESFAESDEAVDGAEARVHLPAWIEQAHRRLSGVVVRTPLLHSQTFSELTGANVYFKCENLQRTGSFKIRGAANRVLGTADRSSTDLLVAASTGNHGQAVATVARQFGRRCCIFVPCHADRTKIDRITGLGVELKIAGDDCVESETEARDYARQHGGCYISPYNDLLVIAGQGTIGSELCEQLPDVDAVFASLGGGGLVSGVAASVKSKSPHCRLFGCSPANSRIMIESLSAGKILDRPSMETLSDGSAGGVEPGAITFDLCRHYLDSTVSLSEREIASALCSFLDAHSQLIEGAAAAAIAGLIQRRDEVQGQTVVVILCGANIGRDKLREALQLADARS